MNFIWSLLHQPDFNCCNLQLLQLSICYGTFSTGKRKRGWEAPLLPRGSLKECDVLLKPEGAMRWGRGNLWREQTKTWEWIKPHSCCECWWPGTSCKAREWIIHCASHRPPGRPQHCFVLQICSPTEADLTGGAAPELFKQKPDVTERAPCDFGPRLPALRFLVSPGLANKAAGIKAKAITHGTDAEPLFMFMMKVWWSQTGIHFTTHTK